MKIKECLNEILKISKDYKIDTPYIVGGLPRDVFLKKEIKTNDVDLTTNSSDSLRLGLLAADKFNCPFFISDDTHITLFFEDFDIDFSSNFISPSIDEYLSGKSDNLYEVYSRDFTINTLHMKIDDFKVFDPTGIAIPDLENKIIRTPLPPEITLVDDPKRAYRAIDFAARYSFDMAPELVRFIKENIDMFISGKVKASFITQRINRAIYNDKARTIKLLLDTGLFFHIPLTGDFKNLLIKEKLLNTYLQGHQ